MQVQKDEHVNIQTKSLRKHRCSEKPQDRCFWRDRNRPLSGQNTDLFKEAQTTSGQSDSISSP